MGGGGCALGGVGGMGGGGTPAGGGTAALSASELPAPRVLQRSQGDLELVCAWASLLPFELAHGGRAVVLNLRALVPLLDASICTLPAGRDPTTTVLYRARRSFGATHLAELTAFHKRWLGRRAAEVPRDHASDQPLCRLRLRRWGAQADRVHGQLQDFLFDARAAMLEEWECDSEAQREPHVVLRPGAAADGTAADGDEDAAAADDDDGDDDGDERGVGGSGGSSGNGRSGGAPALPYNLPRDVCYLCRRPGHWARDCSMRDMSRKMPRR